MFGIGGNCVESPYYQRAIDTTAAPFIGEATPSPARPNGWSERVGEGDRAGYPFEIVGW